MTRRKDATIYSQKKPEKPQRQEAWPWPSPTPSPRLPTEDSARILKMIFDRLDAIEKRLASIEKIMLKGNQTVPQSKHTGKH
ncbi:MAG: hypothetical protein JSV64_06450 [Candidatus Bathyarchaeota archaeon]|nr:MAG: hypothetical protein JSV64_06450 [Candidatus Bathyarchaeota archaeon]